MKFPVTMLAAVLCIFVVVISGCASTVRDSQPTQKSNLTAGVVKSQIIKGVTTQDEVLKLFGAPNLVTKNRSEGEVWNYNKMSFDSVSGSEGGFAIFWSGSRALSSSTTKSFDLIIIFDKKDVVKDYSIVSASY